MSNHNEQPERPTIASKLDRVTGKPATIYTPPEDLVDGPNVPVSSGARLARYAEAIRSVVIASNEQLSDLVDAVVAVADQETAEQRAEVERLREGMPPAEAERDERQAWVERLRGLNYEVQVARRRANAAEAKLSDPWDMDGNAAAQAWRKKAEAESARLASVVELHKKALNVALNLVGIHPDLHTKDDREALEGCRMVLDDEPAALASVAPDTATPAEATGYWVTSKPPHGYTCDCPDEDQHVESREWVASSADDKAGE